MKEILQTTHLEFEKSAFLLDLVRHDTGSLYIEIVQSIKDGRSSEQSIKINPSVLNDLLRTLHHYHELIPGLEPLDLKFLTDDDQDKIQQWYLKGVSVKSLALQFGRSEEVIEMILRNRGISIVSNDPPPPSRFYRRRRRRR